MKKIFSLLMMTLLMTSAWAVPSQSAGALTGAVGTAPAELSGKSGATPKSFGSTYGITINVAEHGIVLADTQRADEGDIVTLTIQSDDDYKLDALQITYESVSIVTVPYTQVSEDTYNFVMPASDVTITAYFVLRTYSIATQAGEHGQLTVVSQAARGETVVVNFTTELGYTLDELFYTFQSDPGAEKVPIGLEYGNVPAEFDRYVFEMPAADIIIVATFKVGDFKIILPEYTVSLGTVTSDKATARYGETVTLTSEPNPGYGLDYISYGYILPGHTGVADYKIEPIDKETLQFTMPGADVKIMYGYIQVNYNVDCNQSIDNGTISVNKSTAHYNDEIVVTVTPDYGYEIESLYYTYNPNPGGAFFTIEDNKFVMPASDVIIYATFRLKQFKIETTVFPEGTGTITAPEVGQYSMPISVVATPVEHYRVKNLYYSYYGEDGNGVVEDIENGTFTMPYSDVTISVDFEMIPYNVNVNQSIEHGSISVDRTTAYYGEEVFVTVNPDNGYELENLEYVIEVGGSMGEARYTIENNRFTMPDRDVFVTASFTPKRYNIETSIIPAEGGTITVPESALFDSEVEATVTPAENYRLKEFYYTYDAGGGINPKMPIVDGKFTMPNTDILVYAEFEHVTFYNVEVDPGITHCTVEVPEQACAGDEIVVVVNPDEGYELDPESFYYTYNPNPSGAFFIINDYKFVMPASDVIIYASCKPVTYSISVAQGITNGSITVVDNKTTATVGEPISVIAYPATGYMVERITYSYIIDSDQESYTIDLEAQGNNTYTFNMPASPVVINATFAIQTYNITLAPDIEHGTVTFSPQTATVGETVTVTATADEHYELTSFYYTYEEVTAPVRVDILNGQFVMPASDVVITAVFSPIYYTIGTSVIPENTGTITVQDRATFDEEVTVTATANEGYQLKRLYYYFNAGGGIDAEYTIDNGTFAMPAINIIVAAEFELATYSINVAATENGTVEANPTGAHQGDEVVLTVTPDEGYELENLTVTTVETEDVEPQPGKAAENVELTKTGDFTYAFVMPGKSVNVTATFKQSPLTGINGIRVDLHEGMRFVNPLGQVSNRPFRGVNIVIDGDKTYKVVF